METIKELRHKLQAEKIALRKEYWGYKTFSRGPSIYITYPLLKTKILPNHITVLVILVGLLGVVFVFLDGFWFKIIGLILLYLNLVLDEVDGEIARYKKIFSLKGIYLDAINHLTIPALFLGSITISIAGVSSVIDSTLLLIVGVLGALSWSVMKAMGKLPLQLYLTKYKGQEVQFNLKEKVKRPSEKRDNEKNLLRKLLGTRYQLREFFMTLVFFFFALIVEQLFFFSPETHPLLSWLILIYGLFLFISLIEEVIKGTLHIENRIVDINSHSKT